MLWLEAVRQNGFVPRSVVAYQLNTMADVVRFFREKFICRPG
jgi:hypothetical protein